MSRPYEPLECKFAWVVGPFSKGVVATKGLKTIVGEVMCMARQHMFCGTQALTYFDSAGLGITVAMREAAAYNNLLHVQIDLSRCKAVMERKTKCGQRILSLRGEGAAMRTAEIVPFLARILRGGVTGLLADCRSAIQKARSDCCGTSYGPSIPSCDSLNEVSTSEALSNTLGDLVRGSHDCATCDDADDVPNFYSAIDSAFAEIQTCVEEGLRNPGGRSGVIIQIHNSDAMFFNDCRPVDELRQSSDTQISPDRMGAFMLRALVYPMRCHIGRYPRIIWAFTGVRKSAGYSFDTRLPLSVLDLSEKLDFFDVHDVTQAVSLHLPSPILRHPNMAVYWRHLVGPPRVSELFCDYVDKRPTSCIPEEWAEIEHFVVAGLYERYHSDKFDAEVAKFCCIASLFSYTGQLDITMDTMHSSVWAIADSGLLRIRKSPTPERGGCKLYFDRPYPMLLTLFAAKYGLPNYVVGPLMRAIGSLTRNSPLHWRTIAELAFAFDLHRVFEGHVIQNLLRHLDGGLRSFTDHSQLWSEESSEDLVELSVAPSLAGIQFGANRIFVQANSNVDAESNHVFRLAFETDTYSGEHVKILLSISLGDHDDTAARRELCNMAATAASYWKSEKRVRTLCVFTGPYFKPDLNVEPRAWFGEVASALRTCTKCRMMQGIVDGCNDCSQACDENAELLECFVSNESRIYGCRAKEGVTPQAGRPFSFYYFGGNHDFWGSCPLHQAITRGDRTALTAYLLSRVNLKHVSDMFRESGDTRMLVWDIQRLDMNIIRLCALEPNQDPKFSQFPAGMTHFVSCMAAYFHGKYSRIIACAWTHGLTGLSIRNACSLDENLELGLTNKEVTHVSKFALLYRQYMQNQGLPDPGVTPYDAESISDCLRKWGTPNRDVARINHELSELAISKESGLEAVIYADLALSEVLWGSHMAVWNILKWIRSCPSSPVSKRRRHVLEAE